MRFIFSFVFMFLLAPAALAARPHGHDHPKFLNHVGRSADAISYSSNLAGAFFSDIDGTFDSITATLQVPNFSGSEGSDVAIFIALDGITCGKAGLAVGVTLGVGICNAWYWWMLGDNTFSTVPVAPGDVLQLSVTTVPGKVTFMMIDNLSRNESQLEHFGSDDVLCGKDVLWAVTPVWDNDGYFPLSSFDPITFSGAEAKGSGVSLTPGDGATLSNIGLNGSNVTSVQADGSSLSVTLNSN